MRYQWNSGWVDRLSDLSRRSNMSYVTEFVSGRREHPKSNHMEWAATRHLSLHNYFMVTSWLLDIERKIEERTDGRLAKSDVLYLSRRFEYPWVFMRLPQRRCRILDAGGGVGPFQYLLSMLNTEVVNVDIDEASLSEVEELKEMFEEFRNITTVHSDFSTVNYPDNYFDAVVCISAVEHGDHSKIVDCVNEFRRVTRGPIMLTMDVSTEDKPHSECVSMNTFNAMAQQLGFIVLPFSAELIAMMTYDGHGFAIACVYLHGENI